MSPTWYSSPITQYPSLASIWVLVLIGIAIKGFCSTIEIHRFEWNVVYLNKDWIWTFCSGINKTCFKCHNLQQGNFFLLSKSCVYLIIGQFGLYSYLRFFHSNLWISTVMGEICHMGLISKLLIRAFLQQLQFIQHIFTILTFLSAWCACYFLMKKSYLNILGNVII